MNIFQEYISQGLSVIPVKQKICQLTGWKQFQNRIPTPEEAAQWSGDVACICGKVSGGLVCIDFDIKNGETYSAWLDLILQHMPALPSKLTIERTPSGGNHVIFRTDIEIKNVKLAINKDNAATIETRGEGGYFVCAPSGNYELQYGTFENVQKITEEETEFILSAARSFNEKVTEKPEYKPPIRQEGLSPFDDYNTRHDIVGLLQSHGWKVLFERNGATFFQRPGKDGRGISATWNSVPDRFYVFSTATQFENNHIYKASAVYAVLNHAGDFSKAAADLRAQGFGDKQLPLSLPQEKQLAKIVDPKGIADKLQNIYNFGYKKGKTTGWKNVDELYSVIKGQTTFITGMPSHGKSQFVDALTTNLAISEGWKFAIFSPENYPQEIHYHQLIEKYIGKSLLGGSDRMTKDEMKFAIDFIDRHFFFIDATEDEISLEAVLEQTQQLINTKQIDGLVIDPWNEIELDKPKTLSTTEYIGACLRTTRKFTRRNNIHTWICVHPTKMQKDKDGNYPVPELYDCEGSAHWRNKADNGICIHRDFANELTQVNVQKIKYRYTGRPGTALLKFQKDCGRYEEAASF